MLDEMLKVQYQAQFQKYDITYVYHSEFATRNWPNVAVIYFEILKRLKNRECNKLETLHILFGTLLDGKHFPHSGYFVNFPPYMKASP